MMRSQTIHLQNNLIVVSGGLGLQFIAHLGLKNKIKVIVLFVGEALTLKGLESTMGLLALYNVQYGFRMLKKCFTFLVPIPIHTRTFLFYDTPRTMNM